MSFAVGMVCLLGCNRYALGGLAVMGMRGVVGKAGGYNVLCSNARLTDDKAQKIWIAVATWKFTIQNPNPQDAV